MASVMMRPPRSLVRMYRIPKTVLTEASGASLEAGLDVTLSPPYSALVLELDPVPA